MFIVAFLLLLFSFTFCYFWRSPHSGGLSGYPRYSAVMFEIRKKSQRVSVWATVVGYVLTLVYWTSGWHSWWGLGAAIVGIWTIVYVFWCRRKNVTPWLGEIVQNGWYNFLLTELPFSYVYVFTWVQLVILMSM